MFVHVVLTRLRMGVAPENLEDLAFRIGAIANTIAGPGSWIVGPNVTEEPLAQGYDFGFVLRFRDRAALDAYHVNPAHLGISLAIRNLTESVLVFDLDRS